MFGLILTLSSVMTCHEFINVKDEKKSDLTMEQKIDILAWRTEYLARICDELNYKIDTLAQYVLEAQNLKRVSND